MKWLLILMSCQILVMHLHGQDGLSGQVVDTKQQPLPYVNLGVLSKESGTVSDQDGFFSLRDSGFSDTDTVRMSMIGYRTENILMRDFRQICKGSRQIALQETSIELKEVKVKPRNWKSKIRGNDTETTHMQAGFSSNDLGCEMGLLIKVKEAPVILQEFGFHLVKSIYDTLFFRLNIYRVRDGVVMENILPQNIFITTVQKSGWVNTDLKPYHIIPDGDYLISIEWVRDLMKGDNHRGLYFSCALFKKNCYYRKTSQGEWKSATPVGLAFIVRQEE